MPLSVACARYSLVKGERIVRFALTTRLVRLLGFDPEFIYSNLGFSGKTYGTKRFFEHRTQVTRSFLFALGAYKSAFGQVVTFYLYDTLSFGRSTNAMWLVIVVSSVEVLVAPTVCFLWDLSTGHTKQRISNQSWMTTWKTCLSPS